MLHEANIKSGGTGFGDKGLPAPQAGLMASLSQGIVGGEMAWPLVAVGVCFGIALILIQVKSPMLVSVGMYLPFGTTAAIFVGGMMRAISDGLAEKRGLNAAQKTRVENAGVLTASGLIAGEALTGLVTAYCAWREISLPAFFASPGYWIGLLFVAVLGYVLIWQPLREAGDPNEAAPPSAMH
jgi:uncharacterized oligopeptide transporter (OPT) family protein